MFRVLVVTLLLSVQKNEVVWDLKLECSIAKSDHEPFGLATVVYN